MGDQILSRNEHSLSTRRKARKLLRSRVGEWSNPDELGKRICIYTTGSFGRSDASKHSDLDVFIVARQEQVTENVLLTRTEEIELLASIVHINRELGLPDLDADGGFLKVHPLSQFLVGLGKPTDDADNTFTGRLLLMLESKPLFGDDSFEFIRRECVERYWTDYADHSDSFLPAFLVNDILRFWRTLCVNYEAGTTQNPARRRAKNYKLKFSRLLTCFSAILAIQAEFQQGKTISSDQALAILDRSPLERLEDISGRFGGEIGEAVANLNAMYDIFLSQTDCSKADLYAKMEDPSYYRASLSGAREFGDLVFRLMQLISEWGEDSEHGKRFLRYIVI